MIISEKKTIINSNKKKLSKRTSEDYSNYGTREIYIEKWTKNLHRIPAVYNSTELPSNGDGENGRGVEAVNHDERERIALAMKKWFMNLVASDKISLDRSLPDQRAKKCQYLTYPLNLQLPKASVVIIFTDEAWTPLLRTVHSIINQTPKELLKEIILVDDFSQRGIFYM